MQLKGKQIKDSSVEQTKLNVTTESITTVSAVTNVEYVNESTINRVESITYAVSNIGMVANVAKIDDKACDTAVTEFPNSNIMVKVNNVSVTVGVTEDCYFSPDFGVTKRTGGNALKGDYLYWNTDRFYLDTDDEIDFIYITSKSTIELSSGSSIDLDTYNPSISIKYIGDDDTNMTLTIDGVDFTVGNIAGDFVWDIGGSNETTIFDLNSYVIQNVNGEDYTIWFDGFGSLLYSVKKGNNSPNPVVSIFGKGFDNTVNKVIEDPNGKLVMVGDFTDYKGTSINRIVRMFKNGTIDNSFVVGSGFNGTVHDIIIDSNGQYVIGGDFTSYNNTTVNRIVRLNQDGTIDTSFVSGSGFNNIIKTLIEDNNGQYVIGGDYTNYNGTTILRMVRLNKNGTIDSAFLSSVGFNGIVECIMLDSDNKYIFTGNFTTYNNITLNRIVRLNQDGTIDTSFDIGSGFNNSVLSITEYNNKYIIGGDFITYNTNSSRGIIRINKDGLIDNSFDVGTGTNATVKLVTCDTDGKCLVGGDFTKYNDTTAFRLVRINDNGSFDATFDVGLGLTDTVHTILPIANNNYIIGSHLNGVFNNDVSKSIVYINNDGKSISSNIGLTPPFHIRMTLVGNLGNFTSGVYNLEPTTSIYPDYVPNEKWVYSYDDLLLYFVDYLNYDFMILYGGGLDAPTTAYQQPFTKTVSVDLGFLSKNPNFFTTFNLGNGATMTLEKIEI